MSVASRRRERWDTRPYRWIASAKLDGPTLRVGFENGDRVQVDVGRLLPRGADVSRASDLTFSEHDVSIPSSAGAIDVSWVSIRLLTDAAFDAHWAAMAAEEARIIGQRIAGFRRERGLSRAALARRADLSVERLSEIEDGSARASFSTLERVLAPLGRNLDDLARKTDDPAPERTVEVGAAGSTQA